MPSDLLRRSLVSGNIYLVPKKDIPEMYAKDGEIDDAHKYYIFLGLSSSGDKSAGVVINSRINQGLRQDIQRLHMPLRRDLEGCDFLAHDSFVDCSTLGIVNTNKLLACKKRHKLNEDTLRLIVGTVITSDLVRPVQLREFGLIQ